MNSVIGCIRDFKMNEVVIGEAEASHKTLPCFDGLTEMGTYFGGGHIILGLTYFIDPDISFYFPECMLHQTLISHLMRNISVLDNYFTFGSQFVLAFELRPQHLTGLLFHVRSHNTSLHVFLMENKVKPFTLRMNNDD